MICENKVTVRTPAESVYLEEMVTEDANFLIMNDKEGNDADYVVPDDANTGGLFDNSSSSEDVLLDDEEDEYMDRILGIN